MKWSGYNKYLVRRYEILLGFDGINKWNTGLKDVDKDKVGDPFHYQITFFFYLNIPMHIFILHVYKQSIL
jgi:hypothetical protein